MSRGAQSATRRRARGETRARERSHRAPSSPRDRARGRAREVGVDAA
jgi:hypothetical protein